MNPGTRKAALLAIGAIAILASANALAHSYAGLYDWAAHHRLSGWQARSWPAEIDIFLAVGELALYIAYLDGWPARQRIWPWATALTGLVVSVAGNIGHIQPDRGQPVILADRLTAAASPLAAFAGLSVGLLVLKMTRPKAGHDGQVPVIRPALVLAPSLSADGTVSSAALGVPGLIRPGVSRREPTGRTGTGARPTGDLLREATVICQQAATRGERVSQRALARQLRERGHRFPNEHLRRIADTIGLTDSRAA